MRTVDISVTVESNSPTRLLLTGFGRGGAHFLSATPTLLLSLCCRFYDPQRGRWHHKVVDDEGIHLLFQPNFYPFANLFKYFYLSFIPPLLCRPPAFPRAAPIQWEVQLLQWAQPHKRL